MEPEFQSDESYARQLDAEDPLASFREQFHVPRNAQGQPVIYFAGNSLGLQPTAARQIVNQELEDWARLAGGAHFDAKTPWYSYHEVFRESGARLVGAKAGEVVMMNGLTVNLHLMMVSFYRPTRERYKILVEDPAFPSDRYAVTSQLRHHGYEQDALITVKPREGAHAICTEDIETTLETRGPEIALVFLGGVNFFTGQVFDMARIAAAAKRQGCAVGFDLAHAAGNVELRLHDWNVDFAVWCSYKYLNAGPGSVAGCFVHEKHGHNSDLPRFSGWWGNDPEKRFLLHLLPDFEPRPGADGWQVSNPPILSMAPLQASMAMFEEAGMPALRAKSQRLTGYLQYLLDRLGRDRFDVITPGDPQSRGCQLSILVHGNAEAAQQALSSEGVACDFRRPNVIRVAPAPLYNTFHEVWRFVRILSHT